MQPTFTLSGITIDYHDALVVAGFWAALFDVELRESLPGWRRLGPLTAGGPSLTFQPVRDPTQGKVRLHLDLQVDDLSDQGARVRRRTVVVVADVEGNEFCLVRRIDGGSP